MFEKRKAAKLRARQAVEMRELLNSLLAPDERLSGKSEKKFLTYLAEHGYADEEGVIMSSDLPEDVVDAYALGLANDGRFIESETSLLLRRGETAYCERAASLMEELVDQRVRRGSSGIGVPLGHGISVTLGGRPDRLETIGMYWDVVDSGYLTVTDERVVYHGGRRTLEFPFDALVTLNLWSDAIDLGVTTREATSSFQVKNPRVLAGLIRAAFDANRAKQG